MADVPQNARATGLTRREFMADVPQNAKRNAYGKRKNHHGSQGHPAHRGLQAERHRDSRLLLLPRTLAPGRMPHVRGRNRKDAQDADRLHPADRRRHGGADRVREGGAGAQGHAGNPARQPSARLPGLRRRRRVRIAGHDLQVRRRRVEVHRHQEPSRRAAVVAGGLL